MIPLANSNQPNLEMQPDANPVQPVDIAPQNNANKLEELLDFVIFGFVFGAVFLGFVMILVIMVRYLLIYFFICNFLKSFA